MRRATTAWLALCLPAAVGLARASEPVTVTGTALLLPEALKGSGLAIDTEPIARQVVIKGDDGGITPLFSDEASRALFEDGRLRRLRTEVKGLRRSGLPYLQVVSFRVAHEGRLRTPEYYCEVCTISVRFPQICPCCQGDMVLRMKPERD
jgi:hypothetical protein